MTKYKESPESKIIFALPRFLRRVFSAPSRGRKRGTIDGEVVAEKWQAIENKLSQAGGSNFSSAVVEADKLLDYCLKQLGAAGETMGERLKSSEKLFRDHSSYQAAWEAHKERNRVVHEHDYDFMHYQAKTTINNFRKALNSLGVLR